jgi:hypothetical protein
MSRAWISVAQNYVMKPIRHDAVDIHEISDGFQNSFEIVFFWLPANEHIECFINILYNITHRVRFQINKYNGQVMLK